MSKGNARGQGWTFVDETGAFTLQNPHQTSALYFPLVNEAGMMSSITPTLHGDAKTGQNTFLMAPVSVEDLHNSRAARNFWVFVEGAGAWSATGNAAPQIAQGFVDDDAEQVTLEAGFLWHKLTRANPRLGLRAEITNFVPPGDEPVELMQVTLTNTGDRPLTLTPTAAIPIYGRSADNLRDHRHVTSLLHRIHTHRHGVWVCPTLSFDERGHKLNAVSYGVLGAEDDGTPPTGSFPTVEEFIGEGGCLEWPQAVVKPLQAPYLAGESIEGYEAMGALRFRDVVLEAGERKSYVVVMAVMEGGLEADALVKSYGSAAQCEAWLERNRNHWRDKLETPGFGTAHPEFNLWLKWVTLQPVLRRLCGNSFLPYHDYGRGGRGWRDLWQDCLALLMMEPQGVRDILLDSYAGVRFDGSNATIIGPGAGEFRADRNDIPRVWMDHGAWPFLTTRLYVDQSGDLAFLLREQTYFKDWQTHRSKGVDEAWRAEQGTLLRTRTGAPYRGTVLEHLLVQHLTAFFNVGQHNNIKLEDADWNDGLDMAPRRGESVAFTALYAGNLSQLARTALELEGLGVETVELASELLLLLDTLDEEVDYDSVSAKQERLQAYFGTCRQTVSGDKVAVSLSGLARDLASKADWLYNHVRTQEWIHDGQGYAWFNGYYDDDGQRVEGEGPAGARMTLTGQVFTLMTGLATDEQARQIVRAAERYLFDPTVGGYRLNSDFGGVRLNLGRCFGFAFGHKENGAMFSHMAVMYAHALYRRGLVHEGHKVLDGIYQHCRDFETCRIYPGIPEYVNARGRGMYTYLTGSASWYLLTMLTQAFGVRGDLGNLVLESKLVPAQFDQGGEASVLTRFAGKRLHVVYHNPARLDYGKYGIKEIKINGTRASFERQGSAAVISRDAIIALDEHQPHRVDVELLK
jgi:cellobiose phosphorylase